MRPSDAWVNHFEPIIAADLRKRRPKPHSIWHLDEVYLKIDGRMVSGAPSTPKARSSARDLGIDSRMDGVDGRTIGRRFASADAAAGAQDAALQERRRSEEIPDRSTQPPSTPSTSNAISPRLRHTGQYALRR